MIAEQAQEGERKDSEEMRSRIGNNRTSQACIRAAGTGSTCLVYGVN